MTQPDRSPFEDAQRVLFLKLRSLGDCVLMTPCLRALKDRHPHIFVSVLVEKPFQDVFAFNPFVDETLVLERKRGFMASSLHRLRTGLELRRRHFDVVMNFHGGSTSAMLLRFTGAPVRAGFSRFRSRTAYTHLVPDPAPLFGGGPLHTAQHQMGLLLGLGLPLPDPFPAPEFHVPPKAREEARRRLAEAGAPGEGFLHLHPTASLPTKQWSPEHFAALLRLVKARFPDLPTVLTTGPDEAGLGHEVCAALGRDLPLFSDLSVAVLAAVMERARAFVGCDSGPAHVAAGLGIPVLSLFGSSDLLAWRPWGPRSRAIRVPFSCQPCPGYRCDAYGHPRCIEELPPSMAFSALEELLA